MAMPGRSYQSSNSYRYEMNGQEKDLEIFEGIYTATYWEYDSRTGRRWNLDPKPTVGISDYACFGNNPILNVDPNGDFKYKFGARIYQLFHGGTILQNNIPDNYQYKEWFVRPEPPKATLTPASGNIKDGYALGEVEIKADNYNWGIGKKLEETGSHLDRTLTGTSGADNDSYQGLKGMRKGADLLDDIGDKASYVPGFGTALGKGLQVLGDIINTTADFNTTNMSKVDASLNLTARVAVFGAGEKAGKYIDKKVLDKKTNYLLNQGARKTGDEVKDVLILKPDDKKSNNINTSN